MRLRPDRKHYFLPVFLGQISGERRTGSEHKHCFIQSNGGRVLVQKGMSNSLLVTCIAVQLFERGLERCMFQQPALFKESSAAAL